MIYLFWKGQIAVFITKKIIIPAEYINIAYVFLKKLAIVLLKPTDINKHTIKLINNKQSSYRPNYSLSPVKLKIFKTYIKINLINNFIKPFKCIAITSWSQDLW